MHRLSLQKQYYYSNNPILEQTSLGKFMQKVNCGQLSTCLISVIKPNPNQPIRKLMDQTLTHLELPDSCQ